jgi:hypothetical protein
VSVTDYDHLLDSADEAMSGRRCNSCGQLIALSDNGPLYQHTVCPVNRESTTCREWVGPEDRCGSDAVAATIEWESGICADHLAEMATDGYHRELAVFGPARMAL